MTRMSHPTYKRIGLYGTHHFRPALRIIFHPSLPLLQFVSTSHADLLPLTDPTWPFGFFPFTIPFFFFFSRSIPYRLCWFFGFQLGNVSETYGLGFLSICCTNIVFITSSIGDFSIETIPVF